jgi:hypothetical protein
MSSPECAPCQFPLLHAQDDELDWVEERPGAVGQPEHAICFVPMQLVLDVDCCLRLHNETDERDEQEEGSVDVFPASEVGGIGVCG